MERKDALTYLMFTRKNNERASTKYGSTPIARSVAAWNMALRLCDDDESKIDTDLLDSVIDEVDKGGNVIEILLNGDFEGLRG